MTVTGVDRVQMANPVAQTEPSVKGKDTNFDFKQLPSWISDQESGGSFYLFSPSPHTPLADSCKPEIVH